MRKLICWWHGHKYRGWVYVHVTMPDMRPREFNTCQRCGSFLVREFSPAEEVVLQVDRAYLYRLGNENEKMLKKLGVKRIVTVKYERI